MRRYAVPIGVGFIHDELATRVEARHRARKTESEKKAEQREHRRVDRPDPFVGQFVVSFRAREANPEADFQAQQNAKKKQGRPIGSWISSHLKFLRGHLEAGIHCFPYSSANTSWAMWKAVLAAGTPQ